MKKLILSFHLCVLAPLAYCNDLEQVHAAIAELEYARAIVLLHAHLKQKPDDIRAQEMLARTYAWDNNYQASKEQYDVLLKLAPDNTDYLFGMASALLWLNEHQAAIPLLEKAHTLQPDNAEYWRMLILSLHRSNSLAQRQRATDLLTEARKRFPDMYWDIISSSPH